MTYLGTARPKKEHVNLEERYFNIVQAKTATGIRVVPIDDKVLPFFEYWYEHSKCEYLLCTRHTCISMLTVAGDDDKIIKKIVGHKGQSVTKVVYTHFEIEELIEAINKI